MCSLDTRQQGEGKSWIEWRASMSRQVQKLVEILLSLLVIIIIIIKEGKSSGGAQ
jgi:hypothetical protein